MGGEDATQAVTAGVDATEVETASGVWMDTVRVVAGVPTSVAEVDTARVVTGAV